ncbi:hypothetical protein DIS24_g4329 [Lasiodiplodia hormozganensis]|uniref:DEUBAD domain-containing protein n=1 Tax=Lasiodiplodia hormozganensis TaxID=869390 RepID=A0AA39YUM4_9PEZI|nr:hypothetical protein DIS24_g4329 [Lasiodiplodia hormozganensis]
MDAKGDLQPRKDDQAESGKQELVVMDVEDATAFPEADNMTGRNVSSKDAEQSLPAGGEDQREEAHSPREGDGAPNVPGRSSETHLYAGNEKNGDAAPHRPTEPTATGGEPEGPLGHDIIAAQPPNTAHGLAENGAIEVKSPSDGDGNPDVVMTDVTQPLNEEAATGSGLSVLPQPRKRPAPTQTKEEPASPPSPEGDNQKHNPPPSVEKDSAQDTAMADAPTEPTRRSGRRTTRRTYREEDSDAEFDPAPTPPSKTKTTPASVSESKRGGNSRIWKPDYLLQDPKSKLAKVDVTTILKDPRAWTSLSPAQQSKIISLLPNAPALAPDPADPTASLPNIPQQMLACNDAFRADISLFQEDLSEGRLDPDWQHDCLVAMEKRARGEFDEWKEREMEAFWGQKQKLSYDVIAGESSKVKLETLIEAGCWEVGDVWVYTRCFGKGKNTIKIEKEATITSITEDHRITFRFPDAQRKFSSASAGGDIETQPLSSVQQLADKCIETDGRISTWRPVNAWKEIRCFRKNQDIGSPWEIRELFWARQ